MATAVYWFFAGTAVVSAVLCITRKNPVASALWLVGTLFSLAALFVVHQAHFIGVIQVLVYAGAIMVLFLFVIMLLNVGRQTRSDMVGWVGRLVIGAIGVLLVAQVWVVTRSLPPEEVRVPESAVVYTLPPEQGGVVGVISEPLFRDFLLPFEITSILLLAAIVGAVVLAKRRL
jgi:NADH-quinone oxidoreductase subunit J